MGKTGGIYPVLGHLGGAMTEVKKGPTHHQLMVGYYVQQSLNSQNEVLMLGYLAQAWQQGYRCQDRLATLVELMRSANKIARMGRSPLQFMRDLLELIKGCEHRLTMEEAEAIAIMIDINNCGDTIRSWGR